MSGNQYGVACPTCGSGPSEHCRTLKTNKVTYAHAARIMQSAKARVAGWTFKKVSDDRP